MHGPADLRGGCIGRAHRHLRQRVILLDHHRPHTVQRVARIDAVRLILEDREPHYLATCPVVLPGARFAVVEERAGLVVVVTADDWATALTIYARAEALLDPSDPSDQNR